ncbi:LytTR family transcriptional regulator [Asticcacaulis sp. AC460]|uniref:LytR/AlgR family response regulator transcription factor n=1 Tax=Asticcacaulis sp. AC460 TaxID=1282360 RepID=UPI0003C3B9D4|nr:response regulator [Asticcacaulis sp. AC460]ESQ91519.1 LytTR family transcriptional regulator [Asticcacaulis sp. AC460]
MYRTLIVDDEPLARLRLRTLLEPEADFDLIGEAHHGEMAVAMIEAQRPDVVFLDVQMPAMTGFEVIEAIGFRAMPTTVFCTAYDEFAVKAFEVQALDYLLKPFDDIRFGQVLERVRKAQPQAKRLQQVMEIIQPPPRLIARSRGVVRIIGYDDIDWVAAAGDYAEVHTGGRAWLVNDSITALTARLPEADFARIHRAAIVRLDRIAEIRPGSHGDGVVRLTTGSELRFSRRYRVALDAWLVR